MAHKTKINATNYEIGAGSTLIGSTKYKINKGRTLIGGSGYNIEFEKMKYTLIASGKCSSGLTGSFTLPTNCYLVWSCANEYASAGGRYSVSCGVIKDGALIAGTGKSNVPSSLANVSLDFKSLSGSTVSWEIRNFYAGSSTYYYYIYGMQYSGTPTWTTGSIYCGKENDAYKDIDNDYLICIGARDSTKITNYEYTSISFVLPDGVSTLGTGMVSGTIYDGSNIYSPVGSCTGIKNGCVCLSTTYKAGDLYVYANDLTDKSSFTGPYYLMKLS